MTTHVQVINHGPLQVQVRVMQDHGELPAATCMQAHTVNAHDVSPVVAIWPGQSVEVHEVKPA
jgi:hypothetical protein